MSSGKTHKSFWEMDELRIVSGAMVILGGATALMVVVPYLLLKNIQPPAGLKPYTSVQLTGRQVYIANGCVYCHSQQPRDIKQAPDASRGWGRASIAADYAYDTPHLLGTMRTGPDLLNIGARQPSKDWHLGHLYQPLDDPGLIQGISQNYFSGEPVSRSDAREVSANWEPWRTVATWYLWRSLDPVAVE